MLCDMNLIRVTNFLGNNSNFLLAKHGIDHTNSFIVGSKFGRSKKKLIQPCLKKTQKFCYGHGYNSKIFKFVLQKFREIFFKLHFDCSPLIKSKFPVTVIYFRKRHFDKYSFPLECIRIMHVITKVIYDW
jgi:hypothetical protein